MQPDPNLIRDEHTGLRRIFFRFVHILSLICNPLMRPFRRLFTEPIHADGVLSFLLREMSFLPVYSSKYNLILCLADQVIKQNINLSKLSKQKNLNIDVLADELKSKITSFEITIEAEKKAATAGWALWLTRKRTAAQVREGITFIRRLVEEAIWLTQKMKDSGAASTAVTIWGSASKLSKLAMSADASSHHQLVSVCVFMLELANLEELDEVVDVQKCRLSILKTWLPFLCRTNYKLHAPIQSFKEKVDIVPILEKLIGKFTVEGQEEVLRLWLHHYIRSDFDWINLKEFFMK